jgi:hypothetical protein
MTARVGVRFAEFEQMALAYPGVEARSSYGTPGLYLRKKFMARLRNEDLDTLVLKPVYDDEQRFLMETQPDVFFLTPHYVGYPTVLIRLSKVDRAQLEELVEQAWRRLATPKLLAERDGTSAPEPKKRARAR